MNIIELNLDAFEYIANYSQSNICSFGMTNKCFYSYWNQYLPKNPRFVSKYVQSLLTNNPPPGTIAQTLARCPNPSYNTPFELTLAHQQVPLTSLQAIAIKFPCLQRLTYKRPESMCASTSIRSKASLCTVPFTIASGVVPIAAIPLVIPIMIAERIIPEDTCEAALSKVRSIVFTPMKCSQRLADDLMRDLYLEKVCTVFPSIQNLQISMSSNAVGSFAQVYLGSFARLPPLACAKKLTLTKDPTQAGIVALHSDQITDVFLGHYSHLPHLKLKHVYPLQKRIYDETLLDDTRFIDMLPSKLKKLTLVGLPKHCTKDDILSEIFSKCASLVSLGATKTSEELFSSQAKTPSHTITELSIDDEGSNNCAALFSTLPALTKLKIRANHSGIGVFTDYPDSPTLTQLTVTVDHLGGYHNFSHNVPIAFKKYPNLHSFTVILKKDVVAASQLITTISSDRDILIKTTKKKGYTKLIAHDICRSMANLKI
jgi:hypothetical protein